MDNETLRKVQLCQKQILDEVVRICDKYNLKYFLAYGTLLGAVRHQGFIPWDDDIDISMPREDYNKFFEIVNKELNEKYYITNMQTDKNYPNFFSKVMKKGTCFLEKISNRKANDGIFIDIFPMDKINDNIKIQKKYAKKLYIYKRLLLVKLDCKVEGSLVKQIVYKVLKLISCFYSKQKIVNIVNNLLQEISKGQCSFIGEVIESTDINSLVYKYPISIIDGDNYVEFEGTKYCCFADNDKYLKICYGDYMKLPPIEQRNNYHGVIEIDLGEYNE